MINDPQYDIPVSSGILIPVYHSFSFFVIAKMAVLEGFLFSQSMLSGWVVRFVGG